jgi:hypothetical protein
VYQGQKVHLFRPSLSFLAEAQQRLENRRGQKAEVRIKFFRRPQKLQTKDIIAKITNLFCISSRYILTIFFIVFFISLPTKREIYYIRICNYILIYIIYGDRTIIGFVVNLPNSPTDGATVSVRKRVTFRLLVSTFSSRVPKRLFLNALKISP